MRYDFPFVVGFCFRFAFCSCRVFHIMSSCASHLHTCSSHASEHFPRCPFCNPALPPPPAPPFASFHVRVLNVLGMDRGFSSGLGIPPVKFRSIWRSFGTPTVNRTPAKAYFKLQANTPPKSPITHLTPLHALGRSITIAWAKIAPRLDSPSFLYL